MTSPHLPPPGNPGNNISFTTLFPWMGDRSQLAAKGYLVPVFATLICGIAIFGASSGAFSFIVLPFKQQYNSTLQICWILALYLGTMSVWAVYMLCGRRKPWWLLPSVGVLMFALLWPAWIFQVVSWPFNEVLRANALIASTSLWSKSLGAFLGPGLSEELFKAIPVICFAVFGAYGTGPLARKVGVTEPLDGVLLGVTCGAAFTLAETTMVYLLHDMGQVLRGMSATLNE